MNRKYKKNTILLSVFVAGLILCGIGTGVMFKEFSDISFGEIITLPENNASTVVTEKKYFEVDKNEKNKTIIETYFSSYYDRISSENIIYDEDMPVGQICYELTYDKEFVKPNIIKKGSPEERPYIYINYMPENQFKLFMEAKDRVLKDLKDKKISSYRVKYFEEIKISMNPKTMKYVEFDNYYF